MKTLVGSVAIDTVPLPEKPVGGFRFESFFLDQLTSIGALSKRADLAARANLSIETIAAADAGGYIDTIAGGLMIDGRVLLIDSLIANKLLRAEHRPGWLRVPRVADLSEFAPSILRRLEAENWSAEKSLDILDKAFSAVSGVAMPAAGSDMDRYCMEHPNDPKCQVMGIKLVSLEARHLAQEIILYWELHEAGFLTDVQTRAIFDVTYRALTPRQGLADLPISAGRTMADLLDLDPVQRNEIAGALAVNRVGMIDPDSPWAAKCAGPNPPPICAVIHSFTVAHAFTTQLVRHDVWAKDAAMKAWDNLYLTVGAGMLLPTEMQMHRAA
jgi:hypothetical protein